MKCFQARMPVTVLSMPNLYLVNPQVTQLHFALLWLIPIDFSRQAYNLISATIVTWDSSRYR